MSTDSFTDRILSLIFHSTENKIQVSDHDLHHLISGPFFQCHILLYITVPPATCTAATQVSFYSAASSQLCLRAFPLVVSVSHQPKL